MSVLSDQGVINTRWGNDSAYGLSRSLRRGAVLATINPVMVNEVRKIAPHYWNKVKSRLWIENPLFSGTDMASCMTMEANYPSCLEFQSIKKRYPNSILKYI